MSLLGTSVLLVCICVAMAAISEPMSCYKRSLDSTGDADLSTTDEFQSVMIDSIKTQFLQKLRMTEAPQVLVRPVVPEVLLRRYEQGLIDAADESRSDETRVLQDGFYGTTRDVIIFPDNTSESVCQASNDTNLSSCLQFQLTEDLAPEIVKSADLWLHPGNSSLNSTYVISELTADPAEGEGVVKSDFATVSPNASSWFTIDLIDTVRAWTHNHSDLVIEVSCVGCNPNLQSPVSTEKNFGPFILITVDPEKVSAASRPKRTSSCTETSSCCVKDFRLAFQDIGWDSWVLFPHYYSPNFCRGSCANELGLARHHHTTVIRNYIQMKRGNTAARLCCVPSTLKSVTLIYVDINGRLNHEEVPNMVVESCDCA